MTNKFYYWIVSLLAGILFTQVQVCCAQALNKPVNLLREANSGLKINAHIIGENIDNISGRRKCEEASICVYNYRVDINEQASATCYASTSTVYLNIKTDLDNSPTSIPLGTQLVSTAGKNLYAVALPYNAKMKKIWVVGKDLKALSEFQNIKHTPLSVLFELGLGKTRVDVFADTDNVRNAPYTEIGSIRTYHVISSNADDKNSASTEFDIDIESGNLLAYREYYLKSDKLDKREIAYEKTYSFDKKELKGFPSKVEVRRYDITTDDISPVLDTTYTLFVDSIESNDGSLVLENYDRFPVALSSENKVRILETNEYIEAAKFLE